MASPASLSVMDTPFCQAVSSIGPELTSPSSLLVKDASKRKRVNRNAKLKQCKLDARREQWLSQVTMMKPGKEGHQEPPSSNKLDLGEIVHAENDDNFTLDLQQYSSGNLDRVLSHSHLRIRHPENFGVEDLKDKSSPSGSGSCVSDCFESEFSPKSIGTDSPKGKVKKVGKDHQRGRPISDFEGSKTKDGITGNIKQSIGTYAVGAHKVEEHDYESENDDWEAAADALGLNHSQEVGCLSRPSDVQVQEKNKLDLPYVNSVASSKPTISSLAAPCDVMTRSASGRAWRPDDAHRPASLPNLNKQQSLPARFLGQKQQWVYTPKVLQDPLSGPSLCPICAEELDSTDSSFEPCVCGFQLCLFCHHRIVSDDGRCPGCRRCYKTLLSASPVPAPSLC